jgi:hypothetical protein
VEDEYHRRLAAANHRNIGGSNIHNTFNNNNNNNHHSSNNSLGRSLPNNNSFWRTSSAEGSEPVFSSTTVLSNSNRNISGSLSIAALQQHTAEEYAINSPSVSHDLQSGSAFGIVQK